MKVKPMNIARVKKATNTKILNTLSSNLKCINIVRTKILFTAAINSAVAIVKLPRSIPVIATVIPVKETKASQTKT